MKLQSTLIEHFNGCAVYQNQDSEFIAVCENKAIFSDSLTGIRQKICDIKNTSNDPLARMIRKFVKDEKISSKVMVLCSSEVPVKTGERTPGSSMFVPASAGIMIASYVVRKIIKK